jgi:DNA-directed RNA polymerase sigma subunit (sigma70/sigma32)
VADQRDGRAERAGTLHRARAQAARRPRTLESLGNELGLSKERVRQLEAAAFAKMRKTLEAQSKEVRSFLAI